MNRAYKDPQDLFQFIDVIQSEIARLVSLVRRCSLQVGQHKVNPVDRNVKSTLCISIAPKLAGQIRSLPSPNTLFTKFGFVMLLNAVDVDSYLLLKVPSEVGLQYHWSLHFVLFYPSAINYVTSFYVIYFSHRKCSWKSVLLTITSR